MSYDATLWAWAVNGLTPAQRLVLLRLADRARNGTGRTWPTVKGLALDTGLSQRTVHAAIRDLADVGLLAVEHQSRGKNPNVYVLQIGRTPQPPHGGSNHATAAGFNHATAAGFESVNPATDAPNPATDALNPAVVADKPGRICNESLFAPESDDAFGVERESEDDPTPAPAAPEPDDPEAVVVEVVRRRGTTAPALIEAIRCAVACRIGRPGWDRPTLVAVLSAAYTMTDTSIDTTLAKFRARTDNGAADAVPARPAPFVPPPPAPRPPVDVVAGLLDAARAALNRPVVPADDRPAEPGDDERDDLDDEDACARYLAEIDDEHGPRVATADDLRSFGPWQRVG